MKITNTLIIIFLLVHLFHENICHPLPQTNNDQLFPDNRSEERRRKNKRKRRPCTRNAQDDPRWFFGHDLTLFLGDVTICGNIPDNDGDTSPGYYEGVLPVLHKPTHKPHRPHKPHKPHKPGLNKPVKPVHEEVEEDYVQDEFYKPGPIVGALNNQIVGQEQNLSNFSPSRIFSNISRHFNKLVNPFIDLFYK